MISSTKLELILGKENVVADASMKSYTTFQAGGNADYLVYPTDEKSLFTLLTAVKETETPYFVLGRGSNILVSDQGYHGVMISLRKHFAFVRRHESEIVAGAGETLAKVCDVALHAGLSGLEFASGIPGTIGGGLYMNAGAYGDDTAKVVKEATVLTKDGEVLTLGKDQLGLAYRHSVFMENQAIVLSVRFSLIPTSRIVIKCTMDSLNEKRREKQPLNYPSAGSAFKRPEGYFAGALIEEAGLKGYTVGGAKVSEKHAGFVINLGDAKASDIYQLMMDVQRIVKEKSNVTLEPEVRFLGDF